jgi:hypothetical protein
MEALESRKRTRLLFADREHHRYPLDLQPSRSKGKRGGRSRIDDVCVVDHAEDRAGVRGCCEDAEDGPEDGAARKLRRRCEVERDAEGLPLRFRNLVDKLDDRRQQLVEARKGDLRLRLEPNRPEHVELFCPFDRVREEGCLPGTSRSTDHERSALAGTGISEQLFGPSALDSTPVQERSRGCNPQGTR